MKQYRRRKKCFIFLDIDGPINTDENKRYQESLGNPTSSFNIQLPPQKLDLLRYIVLSTGAEIVLSSKWRLTKGLGPDVLVSPAKINLENQLAQYNLHIYDETPFIDMEHMRGQEIYSWLVGFTFAHGYSPPYVIIDDNIADLKDIHRGHIVYCSSRTGLTMKEANIVINLLYNQMD